MRAAAVMLVLSSCALDRAGTGSARTGADTGARALDASVDARARPDPDASMTDARGEDAGPTEPVDAGPPPDACVPAPEVCNGADDDCDGRFDEGAVGASTFWGDGDGDGYGNTAEAILACAVPAGYVMDASDCDDAAASVHPGAPEACNGRDDDCNGLPDDGAPCPCPVVLRGARSYLFCSASRSWDGARAVCTSAGYDLGVIDDAAENDWVWSMAQTFVSDDWWIGLRDTGSDGSYTWVDGRDAWSGGALLYANFRSPGFPDGSGTCVEIGSDPSLTTGLAGAWNDVLCSQLAPAVCEPP